MRIFLLSLCLTVVCSCATPNLANNTSVLSNACELELDWSHGKCADYPGVYNFIPVQSEPKPDSVMLYKRLKLIFPNSTKMFGKINIRMFTTAKDSLIKAAYIESTDSEMFKAPALEAIKYLKSLPALDYPDKPIDCWSSYPIYFPVK